METIMRNLKMIIGACVLLILTGGCDYNGRGYTYSDGYNYGRPTYSGYSGYQGYNGYPHSGYSNRYYYGRPTY
jgi:hypothetical protein